MNNMQAAHSSGIPPRGSRESGQASIYLILVLTIFLLAAMAFSVDLTNMWFHRQQAQTAADAACQAGVLDMLALANGKTPPHMNFNANWGAAGSACSAAPAATICQYAKFNGYDGSGGLNANAASKKVEWSFPSSVTGVVAPTSGTVAPYLRVDVTENVKTWFMNLARVSYVKVAASCTCGMTGSPAGGAPIVVLNPTIQGALNISGAGVIKISGGSQSSVQINSSNTDNKYGACGSTNVSSQCYSAITCTGSGQIDTRTAGPNGTGGDVNITGGPSFIPYCGGTPAFISGSSGHWHGGVAAVADPYAWVTAPKLPDPYTASPSTKPLWVPYKVDGCPANSSMGQYLAPDKDHPDPRTDATLKAGSSTYAACLELYPGYYPNGIDLTGGEFNARGVGASYSIAIFAPGVYYLNGNLVVSGGGTVRNAWPGLGSPSSATPNQTGGVTFYFVKGGPSFSGNTNTNDGKIDSVPQSFLACATPSSPPPGVLNGAVLLAPCTTKGSYYQPGNSNSDTLSSTGSRSLLMFASHGNVIPANTPTTFGASGSLTFVGSLYFSNPPTSGSPNNNYGDVLTMNGAAGPNTLIVGQIIADQIQLSGSGKITMSVLPQSSSGSSYQVGVFQ